MVAENAGCFTTRSTTRKLAFPRSTFGLKTLLIFIDDGETSLPKN
jgi:hypothetical protein